MFCRKCGQEIKEGAKFCVKCGTPVSGDAPFSQNTDAVPAPKKEQAAPKAQPQEKKKSGKGLIIALVCVILILLGIVVALAVYYFSQSKNESNSRWEVEERQNRDIDEDEDDADEDDDANEEDDADEDDEDAGRAAREDVAATETAVDTVATEEAAPEVDVPHTYQIVVADVAWTEAYNQARNVENGYLVNIDSQEEWDLVMQLIQEQGHGDKIFWIGAMRKGSSYEYYWIDRDGNSVGGSLNGSSHWLTGEPTYYDDENEIDERYVEMFYSSSLNQWVWNDTPDDLLSIVPYYSGKIAYIIEIEGSSN